MATSGKQGSGPDDPGTSGATEPITLTDPDGAVTRVAPWSSWTREQVRAPGGEPALVTRLDQGQLWFAAGRRRSPWRHEVHVGPAVVSTPRGRFQAVAEPDGGATIACLAGRTRVVAGLREPVLLGPDQSAAVSSDGRTLVVMDRASGAEIADPEIIDLTDAEYDETDSIERSEAAEVPVLAAVGAEGSAGDTGYRPLPGFDERPDEPAGAPEPLPYHDETGPARLGWIPELVAVLAIIGLLVAGVWMFRGRGGDEPSEIAGPVTTLPITTEPAPSTTDAPTTTEAPATSTTQAPTTTAAPTTSRPPAATGATAIGELQGCRRGDGNVVATVTVSHRSGPPSTFSVSATLVDDGGTEFARGMARTELIQPGSTGSVDVPIATQGAASGSCELLEVTSA